MTCTNYSNTPFKRACQHYGKTFTKCCIISPMMLKNTAPLSEEQLKELDDSFPSEPIPTEEDYLASKYEDKIYTSNFPHGKILSIVTDETEGIEDTIYQTSRTNIKATYIFNKKQIVELKITKYEVQKGTLKSIAIKNNFPNPSVCLYSSLISIATSDF